MSERQIEITIDEWETATPLSHPQLVGGIIEDTPEVRALVQSLAQEGKLEISEIKNGLSIQTTSYVGQVQVGNLEVTILPKLKSQSLLNLLRYAYGLRNLNLFSETFHKLAMGAFQDLLISQLVAEVQELISRGIYRNYVRQEEELASPRGRLAIQRIAIKGSRMEARLPCIHHPRTEDCFLNRVVLAGMEQISFLTTDLALRREVKRLETFLETSVAKIRIDGRILERAENSLTRLTTAYRSTITILRLLIDSMGVTLTGTTASRSLAGFLFDMNRFFQAVLSRFLRENMTDCSVQDEYRLRGVIRYDPAYNPRKCINPDPRPDFVVSRGNSVVSILDAKYRDLWVKSLPREMLYQLGIYASVHDLGVATILYPSIDSCARDARLNLHDTIGGQIVAQVWLRPVSLNALEKMVYSGDSVAEKRKRHAFAKQLTFGTASS